VAQNRPEVKQRIAETNTRSDVKQRRTESAKAAWARPETRQNYMQSNARPDVKLRKSNSARAAYARPDTKRRHVETNAKPEVKQRRSAALKAAHMRPEVNLHQSHAERHKPPKGRFKGVSPKRKKWRAYINNKSLGVYSTPDEAAKAYNDGVDKYWNGDGWKNPV